MMNSHQRLRVHWLIRVCVRVRIIVVMVWLASAWQLVAAHEIESTRISLIQREPGYVSASFYVTSIAFFKPILEGAVTDQAFEVHMATLDDDAFAALYQKCQMYYKQKISFQSAQDKNVLISNWQFPHWQAIKKNLQLVLAQQLVNPNAHEHLEPVQFNMQLTSSSDLSSLRLAVPKQWGKVMVISSKPQQRWIENTKDSQWIKF